MKNICAPLCISLLFTSFCASMENSPPTDDESSFTLNLSGIRWSETKTPEPSPTRSRSCPLFDEVETESPRQSLTQSLPFEKRKPGDQRWFNRQDIGLLKVACEKLQQEVKMLRKDGIQKDHQIKKLEQQVAEMAIQHREILSVVQAFVQSSEQSTKLVLHMFEPFTQKQTDE